MYYALKNLPRSEVMLRKRNRLARELAEADNTLGLLLAEDIIAAIRTLHAKSNLPSSFNYWLTSKLQAHGATIYSLMIEADVIEAYKLWEELDTDRSRAFYLNRELQLAGCRVRFSESFLKASSKQ